MWIAVALGCMLPVLAAEICSFFVAPKQFEDRAECMAYLKSHAWKTPKQFEVFGCVPKPIEAEKVKARFAMPYGIFYHYADTVGDGTGAKVATGDHSAGQHFKVSNPLASDNVIAINRMIVRIADTGPLSADKYGGLAALSNGVEVLLLDGSGATFKDLTDGLPIKTNGEWARVCHDVTIDRFGAGKHYVSVRWTFARAGQPVLLKPGWALAVNLQDDFTGLEDHTFQFQGYAT